MHRLTIIRFTYLLGAVLDGLTLVPLLVPAAAAWTLGIADFHPGPDYRYAAGLAAALMAGWTALLVWGFLDPIGRRFVLLLTVVPVIVGLMAAGVYAVEAGLVEFGTLAPMLIRQALLCGLFGTAYHLANGLAKARPA